MIAPPRWGSNKCKESIGTKAEEEEVLCQSQLCLKGCYEPIQQLI